MFIALIYLLPHLLHETHETYSFALDAKLLQLSSIVRTFSLQKVRTIFLDTNAIHINHIDKVSMHLLIPILIDPSLLHLYLTCKENKQKIHNSQTVQMCQRLLQLK